MSVKLYFMFESPFLKYPALIIGLILGQVIGYSFLIWAGCLLNYYFIPHDFKGVYPCNPLDQPGGIIPLFVIYIFALIVGTIVIIFVLFVIFESCTKQTIQDDNDLDIPLTYKLKKLIYKPLVSTR